MTAPALLDTAVIDEMIAQIGEPALRAVIDLFRGESGGFVAAIRDGAARPDDPARRAAARRAAHSLKSSAGQIGAMALSAAAEGVETAAQAAVDFAEEALVLANCADQTEAALAALLGR